MIEIKLGALEPIGTFQVEKLPRIGEKLHIDDEERGCMIYVVKDIFHIFHKNKIADIIFQLKVV